MCLNSLCKRRFFCLFINNLCKQSDQDQQNMGPDLGSNHLTASVPERNCDKKADKNMKNYPACNKLKGITKLDRDSSGARSR